MINSKKTYSLILFILIGYSNVYAARKGNFISFDTSYSGYSNKAMKDKNTALTGLNLGFSFGSRTRNIGYDFTFTKLNMNTDLNHDGIENTLKQDGFTAGLALKLFISNKLYAKLGYSYMNYEYKIGKQLTSSQEVGLRSSFNAKEGKISTGGILIGAGYNFARSKNFGSSIDFNSLQYSSEEGRSYSIALSLKFYISSFFPKSR